MIKLDIVTRATRGHDWLDRGYESIVKCASAFDWQWHIMADPSFGIKTYPHGHWHLVPHQNDVESALSSINRWLEWIPDRGQWVYVLDDDNTMHENFNLMASYMDVDIAMLLMSQQTSPTERRLVDMTAMPMNIDIGQMAVKRSAIGALRFWEIYRGDAYFIQEMLIQCQQRGLKAACVPQVACYYNRQRSPFMPYT